MPLAPPVGALVAALALVAVPVLLLALVWAGVTAARIMRPERPLPPVVPTAREREIARAGGRVATVRQIADDEARRHLRTDAADAPARVRALADELWLRRN